MCLVGAPGPTLLAAGRAETPRGRVRIRHRPALKLRLLRSRRSLCADLRHAGSVKTAAASDGVNVFFIEAYLSCILC